MTRLPLLATVVVGVAVAAMIGLGIWQLGRSREKAALLVRYAAAGKLPERAFPSDGFDRDALFRRANGFCLQPQLPPRVEAGRNRDAESGWRYIVWCRTGAEGPGMLIDLGWANRFDRKIAWSGGAVNGVVGLEPDHRSLIGRLSGRGDEPRLMLIAAAPLAGLVPSAPPKLDDVPNNHLAYAAQWFIFAGLAMLIFAIALNRRNRRLNPA